MPVVQITYDVPLDIAKGLATGELSMLGTAAVRNGKHIAAHIREVSRTIRAWPRDSTDAAAAVGLGPDDPVAHRLLALGLRGRRADLGGHGQREVPRQGLQRLPYAVLT